MDDSSHLADILEPNKALISRNVILTPFLPPKVFTPYAKFDKSFLGNGASACFADNLSVICSGVSAQKVYDALSLLQGTKCRNVLFIGSCGGLGGAKIGDILIAEQKQSFNVEGLGVSFAKYLRDSGIAFSAARVYSVESIKDETQALIDNLEKGGFGGIDLETSVFQRTALSNGFNAGAALYITDKPRVRPFTARFTPEERGAIVSARDTVVRSAVKFVEGLG